MSDKTRLKIEFWSGVIALLSGVTGMFGAFVILPYRVDALEHQLRVNTEKSANDHELLVRIEERLITVQKQLEKK